jgi:bifunctional ADP-heptose synthase (sugar kinase/adenylyltransferase)
MATAVNGCKLRIKDLENLNTMRDPSFRVMEKEQVLRYREHYHETDRKVGFVGGVYDRLSDAHVKYLLKCLEGCDILIVALDNDLLARKRKNDPLRPWDHEQKRARIISWTALAHIITFRHEDEHPHDLIKFLRPDVWFTSSTTKDVNESDRCALQEYCGEIVVFEPQSSEHTTDEFLRIEAYHMSRAAKRITEVLNDMVGPFGTEVIIRSKGGETGV